MIAQIWQWRHRASYSENHRLKGSVFVCGQLCVEQHAFFFIIQINALKGGNPTSDSYKAAMEVLQRDGLEFPPHLTKFVGRGIGIKFWESGFILNARNDLFNVALWLQNLSLRQRKLMFG